METIPPTTPSNQSISTQHTIPSLNQYPQRNIWKFISFIQLIILVGGISYYIYNKNIQSTENAVPQLVPIVTIAPTSVSPLITTIPTISISPTTIQQWKVYKDLDYKFQIEYPANWLFATNKINKNLDKYDELSEDHIVLFGENDITTISTYQFGRMEIILTEKTNERDVEEWFDKKFKRDPSLPRGGYEPEKANVFTTRGGVKILKTQGYIGFNEYYFLSNGAAISARVTIFSDDSKDNTLQSIYEHMMNSLAKTT